MLNSFLSAVIWRLVALLARWLKRPLHQYVSFDRTNPFFRVGLTGFTIRFEQLRLLQLGWNREFLKAALPVQLHSVLIEHFSIHCGVQSPVTIEARGVYVLLHTTTDKYYNAEEENQAVLNLKRRRLDDVCFHEKVSPKQSWLRRKASSLVNFLLFALIRRTEVSVSNVHVRLEDKLSHSEEGVASGIAMETLSIRNPETKKKLEVHSLSGYLNCRGNQELFTHFPEAAAMEKLQSFPFQEVVGCDYIVKPVAMLGDLQLRNGRQSYFDVCLGLNSSHLKVQVSKEQLGAVMKLLGFVKKQQHFRCFLQFCPPSQQVTKESAKEWWQFAQRCVLKYVRGRKGQSVWDQFHHHRSLYKEYSELYEKLLIGRKLSKKLKLKLQAMEDEMELLEVVACRSKVWKGLRLRRVMEDLSDYWLHKNKKNQRAPQDILKLPKQEASSFSLSLDCGLDHFQFLLTEASADEGQDISTILKLDGCDVQLKVSHHTLLSSFGLTINSFNVSGFTPDNEAGQGPRILFLTEHSAASKKQALTMRFTVSHESSDRTGEKPKPPQPSEGSFDHSVALYLQQTVFVFDKRTALRLTSVLAALSSSFNTDLKLYFKEQAHQLKYQGGKRIEKVVTDHEMISVNMVAHLPLLIIPSPSNYKTSDLAIKLGVLQLLTEVQANNKDKCVIEYKGALNGVSVAFNLQNECWSESVCRDSDISTGASGKLLNCPETKIQVVTSFPLNPPNNNNKNKNNNKNSNNNTPNNTIRVDTSISSFEVGLSDSSLRALVHATSSHMDTALQLLRAIALTGDQGDQREDFRGYVGKAELTHSRLAEVANSINQSSGPISKHYLRSGGVEEVDGRSGTKHGRHSVTAKASPLQVTCNVTKVSLEFTSEDRSLLNYFGGSIEGVCLQLRQNRDSLRCHLDLASVSLMDSSISDKGVDVWAPNPVLATQSNKDGKFMSIDLCMVDSSSMMSMLTHHSIKNAVSADVGPVALSLCDASLFSWTKAIAKYYQEIQTIDFQGFLSKITSSSAKRTSNATKITKRPSMDSVKRVHQLRRSETGIKGIIDLSLRASFAELAVSLRSVSVPIAKLCVSGIKANVKQSSTATECIGSVDTMVLLDCLPFDETHSKVMFSNVSEKVLKFSIKKQSPKLRRRTIVHTSSRPSLDPQALTSGLSADITVGGVSSTLLFKFATTLQRYFTNIARNIARDLALLTSTAKTPSPELEEHDSKPRAEPFKCFLSINVHSFSVKLPGGGCHSAETLKVQLESLLLSNKYSSIELSGSSGEAYYSIAEQLQLDFHHLSIARSEEEEVVELLSVPEFGVTFTRILHTGVPTLALSSVPQFKVTFAAELLEIYASNHDINAVFLTLQENFKQEASMSFDEDAAIFSVEGVGPGGSGKESNETKEATHEVQEGGPTPPSSSSSPGEERDILQLDANLRRLQWNMYYVEANKGLPPALQAQHVTAELVVQDVSCLLDVKPTGSLVGETWIMDITAKEVPASHTPHGTLERGEAYIIHQNLYYKKTKPPKLGGGAMDTRRSSPNDTVLKTTFTYSKENITVDLFVQHVHMCLWPHLLSPFFRASPRGTSSPTPDPLTQGGSGEGGDGKSGRGGTTGKKKEKETSGTAGPVRLELKTTINNVSLCLLDKPSDLTSHGVCVEMVSHDKMQSSTMKVAVSDSEVFFSADPIFFEACVMQFGQNVAKLLQVVDPCTASLSYSTHREATESKEELNISTSPLIMFLSMETISSVLNPISKTMAAEENRKVMVRKPSKLENIWELKTVDVVVPHGNMMSESAMKKEEEEEVDAGGSSIIRNQKANLDLPEIVVNFDIVYGGSSNTVLSLSAMATAVATAWSSDIVVDGQVEVSGFLYNHRVAAWEPLIEPLENHADKNYRRWAMIMKVRQVDPTVTFSPVFRHSIRDSVSSGSSTSKRDSTASGTLTEFVAPIIRDADGGEVEEEEEEEVFDDRQLPGVARGRGGEEERESSLALLITSNDRLEVTLSPGALETMLKLLEASRQGESVMKSNLSSCSQFSTQAMLIRNETGVNIVVYPGPTFTLGNSSFSKHFDLSPRDPACPLTSRLPKTTIASALEAMTMSFLGGGGGGGGGGGSLAPDKAVNEDDKSATSLQYATHVGDEGRGKSVDGGSGRRGEELEGAVGDEWDEFLTHVLEMSNELRPKASSLTKLRDYLQRRKMAGVDATPTKWPSSLHTFTDWRPRGLHHKICIQAKCGKKSRPIPISLPGLTPIPLCNTTLGRLGYGANLIGLCEVEDIDGTRVVTIRSSIQIRNESPLKLTLYAHNEEGTKLLSVIHSQDTYSLPVPIYTEKTPLKIGIGDSGLFGDMLDWSTLVGEEEEEEEDQEDGDNPVYISCPVDTSSRRKFYLQALVSLQPVMSDVHLLKKKFNLITLRPTFMLHNLLPIRVRVAEKDHRHDRHVTESEGQMVVLEPGETKGMHYLDPSKEQELSIEIPDYKNAKWKGVLTLSPASSYKTHTRVKLKSVQDNSSERGDHMTKMKIGVYYDRSFPSLYRLFCPYWVHNNTGLKLEYQYHSSKLHKVRGIVDDGNEDSVSMIYFKSGLENKDKKLKLRLAPDGQWSKSIYLGNTGETMDISTKSKDGTLYELNAQSSYSLHVLTQVVHIMPKYIVHNTTEFVVRLCCYSQHTKELTKDQSVLEPGETAVFWPNAHRTGVVHIQMENSCWDYSTIPFSLTRIGTLSLVVTPGNSVLSAVTVRVSPDEKGSSLHITISPYVEGTAVYRLENLTKGLTVKFRQSEVMAEVVVPSGHTQLYGWDNPLLPWQLHWQVSGEMSDLWTKVEDGFAWSREVVLMEEKGKEKVKVYWRVLYDDSQKVFQLFDNELEYKQTAVKRSLLLSGLLSRESAMKAATMQVFCSMEGVGLSLLNDKPVEVLYCSVHSSPAVWLKRSKVGGRFRVLEDSQLLEVDWRIGKKEHKIDSEIFDLEKLEGNQGGVLVRKFNPGLWGSVSVNDTHIVLNVRVGRAQVDNQLEDYALESRIMFAPDKGLAPEAAVAPIVDAAVIIRRPNATQKITLIEDAYLKVKNLQVNVELGVVAALIPLVRPILSIQDEGELFGYSVISSALVASNALLKPSGVEYGSRFQSLAISPFKIAVAYSTIIAGPYSLSNVLGNVVDSIIHISSGFANGTVSIKLDSFKFTGETVSASELYTVLIGHYRNEVLSNIHSVLFGLDIIGNPSKLLGNIETGLKDLVDKSEKGFEQRTAVSSVSGVAVGVKELLGHVIEGSSESLGNTTGSFRNALLETTDLDYKRRHRRLEHDTAETLGANLLLGTRFFAEGLVGGLTDIFLKPIAGAGTSGAKGFFHGLGKGALSILTKPTLGVADLAYFTLEGIRDFADDDLETQPVRLPRQIHPDMIVTPYNIHEAQGLSILWRNPDNSKGTLYYGHHWLPTEDGKDPRVLLINSLNVLRLKKSSKHFKVDNINIKLEYMQEWSISTDNEDAASLFLKYGDDSKFEKIGLFLGIGKVDHNAEVVDQTALVKVDSHETASFLAGKINEACRGVIIYYARLMARAIK